MSNLLIDERPLVLLPSLAALVGVEQAIILQQIHFAVNQPRSGKILADGEKYIWNTYEEWCADHFSFWTPESIRPRFKKLEIAGLLISQQPDKAQWKRHKYYRVNYTELTKRLAESNRIDALNLNGSDALNLNGSEPLNLNGSLLTKTSTKISTKTSHTQENARANGNNPVVQTHNGNGKASGLHSVIQPHDTVGVAFADEQNFTLPQRFVFKACKLWSVSGNEPKPMSPVKRTEALQVAAFVERANPELLRSALFHEFWYEHLRCSYTPRPTTISEKWDDYETYARAALGIQEAA